MVLSWQEFLYKLAALSSNPRELPAGGVLFLFCGPSDGKTGGEVLVESVPLPLCSEGLLQPRSLIHPFRRDSVGGLREFVRWIREPSHSGELSEESSCVPQI